MTPEFPEEHHPIHELVALQVRDGSEEEALFEPAGIAAIEAAVDSFLDKGPELAHVVVTIIHMGHVLESELKSPKAATALLDVVEREPVIEAMKALNRQKDAHATEAVQEAADKFSDFAQKDKEKSAPKDDEEAPEGSVKLGSLAFPKRL